MSPLVSRISGGTSLHLPKRVGHDNAPGWARGRSSCRYITFLYSKVSLCETLRHPRPLARRQCFCAGLQCASCQVATQRLPTAWMTLQRSSSRMLMVIVSGRPMTVLLAGFPGSQLDTAGVRRLNSSQLQSSNAKLSERIWLSCCLTHGPSQCTSTFLPRSISGKEI